MAQIKRIRWTLIALEGLEHAHDYIEKERPSSAHRLIQQVEHALDALIHYPFMGRMGRVSNTRELYIANTPFIIAYRVKEDRLEILGFMHAARRWPDSFE